MAHSLGYAVLLDAAAFVPTGRLSLRDVPADFVTLSFYKVFGYPTGVGALVVRREWLERLRRPWFAGGTVEFASVQNDVHLLRRGAEGFEDGTPNFLALSAVSWGLARIGDIGIDHIGEHVKAMTARLLAGLLALRHADGRPMVTVYGPQNLDARGGTVAFNLTDRHGRWIPHADVEARAAARRVSVRSGCFCNPGAGEHALRFDAGQVASCIAAARDDAHDPRISKAEFARCMGDTPVGAVRASVGIATTERDVDRLLESLTEWRS
jgi:selenocysteine lyase/cysteine desulfurase